MNFILIQILSLCLIIHKEKYNYSHLPKQHLFIHAKKSKLEILIKLFITQSFQTYSYFRISHLKTYSHAGPVGI